MDHREKKRSEARDMRIGGERKKREREREREDRFTFLGFNSLTLKRFLPDKGDMISAMSRKLREGSGMRGVEGRGG